MGAFEKAKILAEIADISSRVYGLLVDKSRSIAADKAKIAELERELAGLKNQKR